MILQSIPEILGLEYYREFLPMRGQQALWEILQLTRWSLGQSRNACQYGYALDFKARCLLPAPPFPDWLQHLTEALVTMKMFSQPPNSCLLNDYQPGQGILPHFDDTPLFGETIVSLSLGSPVMIDFYKDATKVSFVLEPNSLLRLTGEARYAWAHGIAARESDEIGGQQVKRARRISITFRDAILAEKEVPNL